ncbi:MAG: BolA family protein [Gammaproteobacteria bacterium]
MHNKRSQESDRPADTGAGTAFVDSREQRIKKLLQAQLAPVFLSVEDESANHSGKAGAQSHYRIQIVSDAFASLNRIQRHRAVYAALQGELSSGLHAVSLKALSPAQWDTLNGQEPSQYFPDSPDCTKKERS